MKNALNDDDFYVNSLADDWFDCMPGFIIFMGLILFSILCYFVGIEFHNDFFINVMVISVFFIFVSFPVFFLAGFIGLVIYFILCVVDEFRLSSS